MREEVHVVEAEEEAKEEETLAEVRIRERERHPPIVVQGGVEAGVVEVAEEEESSTKEEKRPKLW